MAATWPSPAWALNTAVTASILGDRFTDPLNETTRGYVASTSTVDVNTTSPTDIFSQSIGAGHLSTDRLLRLTAFGDVLHNNAGADTLTIALKLGASTLASDTINFSAVTSNRRQPWSIVAYVANAGATNSQYGQLIITVPPADAPAPGTGIGDITAASATTVGIIGNSTATTENTTAAKTLAVTVTWSAVGSSANSFRKRYAALELVQ